MQSRVPLDYAVFQLSPKRSRCELFVSYEGTSERLASGLVKPFVTHLKVAEEQVASAGKSIKLDVERFNNAATWFTKGTLERFVRFVSTPEVLETVNTFDAEMSQLEAARKIYSQGMAGNEFGGVGNGVAATSDATKNELLRAIDVRLSAVKQDLMVASGRASTAGFNPETVSELRLFAGHFGAHRLSEACTKYITITQRRADLFSFDNTPSTRNSLSDSVLRSSVGSDMSLDDSLNDQPKPAASITTRVVIPPRQLSREPSPSPINNPNEIESTKGKNIDKENDLGDTTFGTESTSISTGKPQLTRRLSVQERISLFENKTQISPSATTPATTVAKPDLRRLPSEVNLSADKAVLRRWSGASDMSVDVSGDRKEPDSNANTPTPSTSSLRTLPPISKDVGDSKPEEVEKDSKLPVRAKFGSKSAVSSDGESESNSKIPSFSGRSSINDQSTAGFSSRVAYVGRSEEFGFENHSTLSQKQIKYGPRNVEQFGSHNQITTEEKLKNLSGDDSKKQEPGNSYVFEADSVSAQRSDSKSLDIRKESQSMPVETPGLFRGTFQGNGSAYEQVTKHAGEKEGGPNVGGSQMILTGKGIMKNQNASSVPMEQVQRVRQPNVNQVVNDELKLKANELEKLFAEHKLRVPGDQSNSARRVRPVEIASQDAATAELSTMKSESENPAGSSDYDVTPKRNIYSHGFSDDSRGKSYLKYMQKRDAKLREDWSSNRSEKEAKLKAMQDSLEEGRAEMKVKLASSAEKRNSAYDIQQRAQNTRSFNVRSTVKRGQSSETFMSDEDEGQAESLRSKSAQTKKVQPNKNASSPATRNPPASNPRPSVKAMNSASGRRRLPYDTPLAQSVPNFSDLKKENMKPSSIGSKSVRPQARTHVRKKSTVEDLLLVNEEKPRRFQSSRKNMGLTSELNNSRNSDDVDDTHLMPSKYHSEENGGYEEISTDTKPKTLSRKGNGSRRGAGSDMGLSKGFGETSFETEEMTDVVKNDEQDYEMIAVEESTYVKNSEGRLSHESDKSGNCGYENDNAIRFVSQAGSVSAVESPNSVPSLFRSMGSTLDSSGESPGYWNPRRQNPFAFSHEISDMDASDSPNGSPASWNFDAEAAKMRKKWGAAQKPIVGIESPHNSQSRKDVSRGLKRFLNFGKKNRASDSLADWISVTTSEGDDSEDGRDLANRSSEDLRKSRMGFLQNHNSDEGFNEIHASQSSIPTSPPNSKTREKDMSGNSLKASKSFFSLANFRTKSNEAKPR